MKKKEHIIKKFLLLGFICWVIYCGSEFLLYLVLYRETMSHERDYSILFWTQHVVLSFAYHMVLPTPIPSDALTDSFRPLRTAGHFFHENWKQLLLLGGCAILYELLQARFPQANNLASAFLVLFFPSAALFHTPVIRTAIGFSISFVSIILVYILIRYRLHRRQNTQ